MSIVKKVIRKSLGKPKKAVEPGPAAPTEPLFDQPYYQDITDARLKHLETLQLDVAGKSVIDIGCGIGRLSTYFADRDCDVLCVDGRSENIAKLKELYPSRKAAVVDVETAQILDHGSFDVAFCYGLLYHLCDPFGLIKNVGKICKEIAIIETCIMDANDPVVRLVYEDQQNVTQALHPMGCRPSIAYVVECMKLAGFEYVYRPTTMPSHAQFKYKLNNDYKHLKNGNLIRGIFIGSRRQLDNSVLQIC